MDPLLQQIADLLQQYLAQGSDTPVAGEASALLDAINSVGDQGQPGQGPPATAGPPDAAMTAGDAFGKATKSALSDIRSQQDQGTKGVPSQFQPKKKTAKAPVQR